MTTHTLPQRNTAAFRAALHLHKSGPLSRADLLVAVHFGDKQSQRIPRLNAAIERNWLIETHKGIACGPALARHFHDNPPEEAPTPKFVGQVAGPRDIGNVYTRPAWRSNLNSKGTRADVPAFSVRATPSFHSVGGA